MTNAPMLPAALAYPRLLGWAVFLCLPGEKEPATRRGCRDATDNESTIREMFAAYPNGNIGIACGSASNVFVVDLDEKHGISGRQAIADLEEEYGRLPATVEQITPSGGRHLLFRCPDVEIRNSAGRIAKGIDIRGEGGYIMAAPSVYRDVGAYRWNPELHPMRTAIAEAPEWLIKLAARQPEPEIPAGPRPEAQHLNNRYGEAALDSAVRRILDAGSGTQESTLNGEAYSMGRLAAGGALPPSLALESLIWAGQRIPSYDPRQPWRATKVEQKIRRAFAAGLRQPREVPRAGA
jgi:hypothetical protein